jgi:hypothetical protein
MKRLRTVNRRGRQAEQRAANRRAAQTAPDHPEKGEADRRQRKTSAQG